MEPILDVLSLKYFNQLFKKFNLEKMNQSTFPEFMASKFLKRKAQILFKIKMKKIKYK